jgi:serine/threonine protein kinase
VALDPGTQLGCYTITSQIGLGGMGVVYRARDTKLKRDVAIKTLPRDVASDPERLARLQREAEVLASLNHPNIAHLYGLEGSHETTALVMELVEGPTLADRIALGPVPIEEAIPIVGQIVDALEAAHEQGVVHRDMKPANIKLRPDGVVKVLDFGLAKALDPVSSQSSHSLAPTMTTPAATEAGSILGTAPYMSPEQAMGKPVDKRTDIWAFGCTVYEMLTGRSPFARETKAETLVAILERQPDWTALPAATPAGVRRLIARCLTKDLRRRLRDIGDARPDLADEEAREASMPQRTSSRPTLVQSIATLVLTAVVAGALVWIFKPAPAPSSSSSVARLTILPPPGESIDAGNFAVAISPDGRRVAYVAGEADRKRIYVRAIDQFDSLALPGTEGGNVPFFSPDSQWVGFIAGGKIRRTRVDGGQPQTVTDAVQTVNALAVPSWERDDNIYFTPGPGTGIWRIPSGSGPTVPATMLQGSENSHRWPQLLPDGKTLLFSAATVSDSQVYVQLATGERRKIVKGLGARYLPSGHLVYVQGGALMAVRFDANRFEVVGEAARALSGFMQITRLRNSTIANLAPEVSVSTAGTVAYVPARSKPVQEALVWVSRTGVETTTGASGGVYFQPRLSPDGSRVAVTIGGEDTDDVWLYELARRTWSRATTSGGNNSFPLWSPDGRRIAHVSDRSGPDNIYAKSLESTKEERLLVSAEPNYPFAWSRKGTLFFVRPDPITLQDIFVLRAGETAPAKILDSPFGEGAPALSPDERWLAYVSNETGRNEIYVMPFERPGEKSTISNDGGNEVVWSPNGRELFFRNGSDMMVVDVSFDPVFSAGKPRRLFTGNYERTLALWPNYDVANDGQRFLMVKKLDTGDTPNQINVVLNWIDELNQLLPPK